MTKQTKTVEEIIERIRELCPECNLHIKEIQCKTCYYEPELRHLLLSFQHINHDFDSISANSEGGLEFEIYQVTDHNEMNNWKDAWFKSFDYSLTKSVRQNLEDSEDLRQFLTDTLF